MEAKIQVVKDHGYTGKATHSDWLRFMSENGGSVVFGNEQEQNRVATLYTGDIELFCQWYFEKRPQDLPIINTEEI